MLLRVNRLSLRVLIAIMVCMPRIIIAIMLAVPIVQAQRVALADVEIRMARNPGQCAMSGGFPCPRYEITIRGDGIVEYHGVGIVEGNHKRTVPADDVVSLVNEFLGARFLESLDAYTGRTFIVRKGDSVDFIGTGRSGPWVDLSLRMGERRKAIKLQVDYPAELQRLTDLVDGIGGPAVWGMKPVPSIHPKSEKP